MAVFHTEAGRQFSSVRYHLPTTKKDNRVIVIGSGPAGAMAAHQLRKNGIPVVMLEAGTSRPLGTLVRVAGRNIYRERPDINSVPSPDYIATGDAKTEWHYSYSHGGLSNYWTGAVPRFAPEDFYEGARLDERYRWPVHYRDLITYYNSVEKLVGVTGSRKAVAHLPAPNVGQDMSLPDDWRVVAREAAAYGQGLTVMPLADGADWFYARQQGTAFNSFTRIVEDLMRAPNFELISGAMVERLEWNDAKNKVDSVTYRDVQTGARHRISGAAVVVACGALNSARLLLNSTSHRFPQGLGNEYGVLGKYLHDHPREWWTFHVDKRLSSLSPSAYLTRQRYEDSEPLLATSWTLGLTRNLDQARNLVGIKSHKVSVQIFGTMIPTEKYYVELADSSESLPKLKVHIAYDDAVVKNVVDARQRLLAIMGSAGYDAVPDKIDEDQLRPGTSVHYGGTVRMHASPQYGMLDGHNRLHAAPNVLVCDASAFTTSVEKNPTLTAMALSARAADRLAVDLKRQKYEPVHQLWQVIR